jgi:hypothetical protein
MITFFYPREETNFSLNLNSSVVQNLVTTQNNDLNISLIG